MCSEAAGESTREESQYAQVMLKPLSGYSANAPQPVHCFVVMFSDIVTYYSVSQECYKTTMSDLVHQFCPNSHDAPISGLCWDPNTGVRASADQTGRIAITRRGETLPGLVFQPGGPIEGAIALLRGGGMIAVGDDHGSVGVYKTKNGESVFRELREPPEGRVRAMRAIAISPNGERLASLAVDGLIRLWDLSEGKRLSAWKGFIGRTLQFDTMGERLLCLNESGNPCLVDLRSRVSRPMEQLQSPAHTAYFTRDNTLVVCAGNAGISLLRVADGALVASFATKGGSGIEGIAIAPDDREVAVITQRSAHYFSLPDLQPVRSEKHGAPEPSGSAIWTGSGLKVGGSDGLIHGENKGPSLSGTSRVVAFGAAKAVAHEQHLALWDGLERTDLIDCKGSIQRVLLDRDGRFAVAAPRSRPVVVYRRGSEKPVFTTGKETVNPADLAIGGKILACQLKGGGLRWWNLSSKQVFELRWPKAMALTGGGTWLAVVTPKGAVRVLDPNTGQPVVGDPVPLADVPVKKLAFMNRRPELVVLDNDGVLGLYNIAEAIRSGTAPVGKDLIDFNVEIDQIWGITGGRFIALRVREKDSCTILLVDIDGEEVCLEFTGLHPQSWVDPESGHVYEPARANAIIERDIKGRELRVYRSLPGSEWLTFGPRGIEEASRGAGHAIGSP